MKAGREDLIGFGEECLIPPRKIKGNKFSKNPKSNNTAENKNKKPVNNQKNKTNKKVNKATKANNERTKNRRRK